MRPRPPPTTAPSRGTPPGDHRPVESATAGTSRPRIPPQGSAAFLFPAGRKFPSTSDQVSSEGGDTHDHQRPRPPHEPGALDPTVPGERPGAVVRRIAQRG